MWLTGAHRSYNPVIVAQWLGLNGLIECLSEQVLARGTGALSLSDETRIYVVFGHPLHAVDGTVTGVQAIDEIADLAASQPSLPISWIPRLTAGKAHSLRPADGVVDRLRRRATSRGLSSETAMTGDDRQVADLGLRRIMSEQGSARAFEPDPVWAGVLASVTALLDLALHHHAAVLLESLGRAELEPHSILMAIERSRSMPIRTVAPGRVCALLDQAEAMVRGKMAAG